MALHFLVNMSVNYWVKIDVYSYSVYTARSTSAYTVGFKKNKEIGHNVHSSTYTGLHNFGNFHREIIYWVYGSPW